VEIVVAARPDREIMVRAMRHVRRVPVRKLRLLCAGYVVAGVALLFVPNLYVVLVGSVLVMLAVLTQLAQWAIFRRALWRNRLRILVPRTITLTDCEVQLATTLQTVRLDWRAVKGVDHIHGLLVIRISDRMFWPVPTDGLTGEEIGEIIAAARAFRIPVSPG
jgi:hypothetical protein